MKSAECLKQYYCIVKDNGPHVPVRECKRAIVAVKKHVVLWSEHSGMNAKPKHHALYELARGIEFAGNPNIYSTYMEESIHSIIARLARTVHPRHFALVALKKYYFGRSVRGVPF